MKTSSLVGILGLLGTMLTSGHAFALADALDAAYKGSKDQGKPKASGDVVKLDDTAVKEKRAAGGYSYSDKGPKRAGAARPRAVRSGPSATFPSFTATDGGGSRIVVHLSGSVPVEERKAAGSVTYILKGVHVNRWNDTNPLVTVHFNTPVSQARLVPHGGDLHLVVDLRAASAPTFKVNPGQQQGAGAALEIEFPKGDFATGERAATAPASAPATTPAPKAVAPVPAPSPAGPKP